MKCITARDWCFCLVPQGTNAASSVYPAVLFSFSHSGEDHVHFPYVTKLLLSTLCLHISLKHYTLNTCWPTSPENPWHFKEKLGLQCRALLCKTVQMPAGLSLFRQERRQQKDYLKWPRLSGVFAYVTAEHQ